MKNVIFDFGNVIIRWRPFNALHEHFASEAEMMATLEKIGFYDWNLEQDRGRSWADGIAAVEKTMPDYAHIFRTYAENLGPAHSELVPGTSELIERLHARNVTLVGLTNAAEASFQAVRAAAPVINLMSDVVVSAKEGLIKPSSEIFELCLNRSGLDRTETLFVDDSAANCAGAEAIGLAAHHFTTAEKLEAGLLQRKLL